MAVFGTTHTSARPLIDPPSRFMRWISGGTWHSYLGIIPIMVFACIAHLWFTMIDWLNRWAIELGTAGCIIAIIVMMLAPAPAVDPTKERTVNGYRQDCIGNVWYIRAYRGPVLAVDTEGHPIPCKGKDRAEAQK